MFNIRADLAAYVARFAATSGVRFYLNGIYVEPCKDGGAILVATDGVRMMIARDLTGRCDRPTVCKMARATLAAARSKPRARMFERRLIHAYVGDHYTMEDAVERQADGTKKPIQVRRIRQEAQRVVVADCGTQTSAGHNVAIDEDSPIIDGQYPDWRRVIPKGNLVTGWRAAYQSHLLDDLAPPDSKVALRVYTADDAEDGKCAMLVKLHPMRHSMLSEADAMLVVMAAQVDPKEPVPQWARPAPTA